MTKRLFADLLLVTLLMAAALFVARGILQSSAPAFFGAWMLALGAMAVWLKSRSVRDEPESVSDDSARPRTAHFK
ncbi:hypothetical protein [Acidovorax sp. CCYZU-2555]|uniref:hypothetical protein n=1 Tax=Acidovorax sp. CCYZU-2555 TaxID=2835042 RepID=UPI001BCD9B8F|nr:hypothetical protein [Acidovorax sp. CCYZU-2555]MBS7776559.1 hypothetical protein [Acidovorax sp. CCYZU-2555]